MRILRDEENEGHHQIALVHVKIESYFCASSCPPSDDRKSRARERGRQIGQIMMYKLVMLMAASLVDLLTNAISLACRPTHPRTDGSTQLQGQAKILKNPYLNLLPLLLPCVPGRVSLNRNFPQ